MENLSEASSGVWGQATKPQDKTGEKLSFYVQICSFSHIFGLRFTHLVPVSDGRVNIFYVKSQYAAAKK